VLAQANQQKQFDEINRAAILSRIQAARPVQQMGMVSFIDLLLVFLSELLFWVLVESFVLLKIFHQNSTFDFI
jgi:hypothetical protein